jgi:hypothetical protein
MLHKTSGLVFPERLASGTSSKATQDIQPLYGISNGVRCSFVS